MKSKGKLFIDFSRVKGAKVDCRLKSLVRVGILTTLMKESFPYDARVSVTFADNAYILEDEGVYCGWQNYYDEKTGVCDFYLTVFEDDGEGYIRYDETQREKKYSERQLTEALERAGFEVVGFFGGYDMSEPKNDTERWYIAAKKV